jgi:hypothetical protein
MKRILAVLSLLLPSLHAMDFDTRLARLIGPNAWSVSGCDVARMNNSALSRFGLVSGYNGLSFAGDVHKFIEVSPEPGRDRQELSILVGVINAESVTGLRGIQGTQYRGILVAQTPDGVYAYMGNQTVLHSDLQTIQESIDRWLDVRAPLSDLAQRAQQLDGAAEWWAIAIRPFQHMQDSEISQRVQKELPKSAAEFVDSVSEVRFSLQLGTFSTVKFQLIANTPEDAAAVARLARFFPGFIIQLAKAPVSDLVGLAESVDARAEGRVATLSLMFDENKVNSLPPTTGVNF